MGKLQLTHIIENPSARESEALLRSEINLKGISLSGRSLTQKAIHHTLPLLRHSGQRNTRRVCKLLGIACRRQLEREGSKDAQGSGVA